jgi:hypothetical protein
MVTLIDICVLTGAGLVGGICTGLLIRSKQINNLKDEVADGDNSYDRLLDLYMEKFYSQSLSKTGTNAAKKKGPGRPKGSKNKPKENVKPTTRKYTRKSSK